MSDLMHIDHPDDDRYDEINVYIAERWKESELSGDEWRFTYIAEVKRKGEKIITISASRLDWLLQRLHWGITTAGEKDNFDIEAFERTKDKCDQPGCANTPVVFYIRKKRYTRQGEEIAFSEYYNGKEYRQFCDRHKHRGDCGLDDADHNYEEILDPRSTHA